MNPPSPPPRPPRPGGGRAGLPRTDGRGPARAQGRDRPRQARPAPVDPDPARTAAAWLVSGVLDDKRTLDEAMKQEPRFVALQGRDRAFAANLALATLRALGNVDEALARHLARPLPDSARFARATLRTGAAQMLEGIAPVHAAVGRAVDIARHEPTGRGFTGLINAVLRKVALIDPATLPARGRVPQVWWSRWRTGHGEAAADRIADSLTGQPALDLTVLTDVADWLARAAEAGIAARRLDGGPAGPASVRLEQSVGDVTGLPGWADGEILVQDAAAALPARLLGVRRGQTVLDLCAAPGGKTVQLAAMGAAVVAMDIDAARLDRVRQNLERTHLDARLEVGDATRTVGEAACDAILLDAPCTATGTLRRNPETLWIKSPADVARLSAQQGALVEAAARALAPGGRLVYAVCSLEAEEADPACARALACGLEPDPIRAEEVGMFADALTPDGRLRILPSLEARGGVGSDGFFIARFRRPAAVAC